MPVVQIESARYWNNTRIPVKTGERYEFEAQGTWSDAGIVCGPEGYRSPNFLFVLLASFRREPRAQWFALIGAINGDKATQFLIGTGVTWTATQSGVLTCFANDLPLFYFNNSGAIDLVVTRVG